MSDHTIDLAQSVPVQRFLPRDRESFFEAQRRNRHATWRLSAASTTAAIVMGIPLALLVTPLIYTFALIVASIVNYFAPLPAAFWQESERMARFALLVWNWLFQHQSAGVETLVIGTAVLLLPGAILSIGLWLAINALFRRAGVGGALLVLEAREPNPSDLKELQLSDVVQEMAIAAGLPAPRTMLIDSHAVNAAAIGTSPNDARIIVTRGLLDQLDRDQLEGALAHLVSSIGNGDLRIAFRVTSIFETCGLLRAVINSPFGPESRCTLWRIVRYASRRKAGSEDSAQEAAAIATLLTRGAELETDDIDRLFEVRSKKSFLRSVRMFLLFPIFLSNTAIKLSLWFFSLSMLEPCLAFLWRTRKYLADASAIQLTRNPDGLAQALLRLNAVRASIPGGQWASHLFLVSPGGTDRMNDQRTRIPQGETMAQLWAASAPQAGVGSPPHTSAVLSSVMGEIAATARAAALGDQDALVRMDGFRQTAAAALGTTPDELPSFEDIAEAQRGDSVALQHLLQFRQKISAMDDEPKTAGSEGSSVASGAGYVSFHPSLKRRLKRLDCMGAHVALEADDRKKWIMVAVLAVLLGPFALAAIALLLLLIAIMMMASIAFLTMWMAVIHQIFLTFVGH